MTVIRPSDDGPTADDPPADQLTPAAHLKISAVRATGLTAIGAVPPADAPQLITVFGITGIVATATLGAVTAANPWISLAVLVLGLVGCVLVAFCAGRRRPGRRAGAEQGRPRS
jgi:hypothetical protein